MADFPQDRVLLPTSLNSCTYSRLVMMLSENQIWKRVAIGFGIFSCYEIDQIAHSRRPAETLLFELGARLCPISFFCDVLRRCRLHDVLDLFKPYEPIIVTRQPCFSGEEIIIERGGEFKLICRATVLPHRRFQWYFQGRKIMGQNDPVLLIENFGLHKEGYYFCAVSQEGCPGLRLSGTAVLKMAPEPPEFLVQPACSTICRAGSKVLLSVSATGHPAVKYQWFKDSREMRGCTGPFLSLHVRDESQEGIYRCFIYNTVGHRWSDESLITLSSGKHPEPTAKIALLIANQIYDNLQWLNTPENDVVTLVNILQALGFHTIALQNLTLSEMRNVVYYFSDIVPKNAYVLFYFSGHGFEIYDKYMLPVNAPGPQDFLQVHALSEKELLRAILRSQPMLFLELLDMCLKPPDPSNKRIFNERINLYEYSANHNLIQAYATTSYLGAYEKSTEENGLYVKFLKEYFSKKRDMPIVEILRNVAKDISKVCPLQKPFFGTNVTVDYRLTDRCSNCYEIGAMINSLAVVPVDFVLRFKRAGVKSRVSLIPYLGVFFNTVEVQFSNLQEFRVSCEVPGDELTLDFTREDGIAYVRVMNLQKLDSNKTLVLRIYHRNGRYLDNAKWDLSRPLIAVVNEPKVPEIPHGRTNRFLRN